MRKKRQGGQKTYPDMFGNKEGAQLFKAHLILDRKKVQIQETFVGNNWRSRHLCKSMLRCFNWKAKRLFSPLLNQ